MKYVLYNPLSGNGGSKEIAESLGRLYGEDMSLLDITAIEDIASFALGLSTEDAIVLCGGDGTINRFVNLVDTDAVACRILYFPAGTGNDFATDIGFANTEEPVDITEYTKGLPTVTINGKSYKFINGVGYGIDGYCCEVGDKIKDQGKKPNYTAIAIKGLLFGYKPKNATVIVDGKEYFFKKTWIAPTMFGRCYGGGMIATPEQKRGGDELSLMMFHGRGKLATLMAFPKIFTGEHVKKKMVTILTGKAITVKFSAPSPLQVDGETIVDVSEYTAYAPIKAKVTE